MTDERIELAKDVFMHKRFRYSERADILVRHAEISDRYKNVTVYGIESLIGAGAEIDALNCRKTNDKKYYHQVFYQNIYFRSDSPEPLTPVINPGLLGRMS
jgi:hypothetical protein|tara:strand:- start:806 stop:1108 length:303 start_codon:yes stop_codon:yes gene_type:complete